MTHCTRCIRICALLLAMLTLAAMAACGRTYTCENCEEKFSGKAYYGISGTEIMCEDCARSYWVPFDYENFAWEKPPKQAASGRNASLSVKDNEGADSRVTEAPADEEAPSEDILLQESLHAIFETLDAYDAAEDAEGAIPYLDEQIALLDITYGYEDEALAERLDGYRAACRQNALTEAKDIFAQDGYEAACKRLYTALGLLGGADADIEKAIEYYGSLGPAWLSELEYFQRDGYSDVFVAFDEKKDTIGETHEHVLRVIRYAVDSPCSQTYYINGKYSTLSGNYFVEMDDRDKLGHATVSVYGDDALLYTFPEMASDTLPGTFTIDVSGVTMLRIEARLSTQWLSTCLGEARLEP